MSDEQNGQKTASTDVHELESRPVRLSEIAGSLAQRNGTIQASVVLPCLNEAESVGVCVRQALQSLSSAGIPAEVVVVDNGSTDDSADVARRAGARVIAELRPGYGSALRAGIAEAEGDIVVMADADCTYSLDRTHELVQAVKAGEADLVLGKRCVTTRESMPVLHRFLGTPLLSFLIARATGGRVVTDSQSGFRAFRKGAVLGLGLRATGMEFASEMLISAARSGWSIKEIPTEYRERVGDSKLNTFADGWRHLRLIGLLAPDLLLVWPGAAALTLGFVLAVWSLIHPAGILVGSITWQPVFFSTIAMVLGTQALMGGLIVAYVSSVFAATKKQKFSFVGRGSFLAWCARGGLAAAAIGLIVDAGLFVLWTSGEHLAGRILPLAALAQGLIISGTTVAVFGLITRLFCLRAEGFADGARPSGLAVLINGRALPPKDRGTEASRRYGTPA